jgi:hypothetical protein
MNRSVKSNLIVSLIDVINQSKGVNLYTMSRKSKKEIFAGLGTPPLIAVDPSLPSFDGHPFFEKKATKAKALLKKVGIPNQFSKKTRS